MSIEQTTNTTSVYPLDTNHAITRAMAESSSQQDQECSTTTKKIDNRHLICNPFVRRTWIRTGLVLLCCFGLTLFVAHLLKEKKQKNNSNTTNDLTGMTSSDQDQIKYFKERYYTIHPIVTTNFSDWRDFVDPMSAQSKALDWIVYKDQIIQLTPMVEDSTVDFKNETNTNKRSPGYTINETNMVRLQQRYVAMVLFYSLAGEGWVQKNQTAAIVQVHERYHNQSECTFVGFFCENSTGNSSNIITEIDLSGRLLAGTIPIELGLLTALESLNLAGNMLDGALPAVVFKELTRLEVLNIEQNSFSSTLPSTLGMLENLKYLNIGYNKFTGVLPMEIRQLVQLETFNIRNNPIVSSTKTKNQKDNSDSVTDNKNELEEIFLNQPNLQHIMIDATELSGSIPQNMSRYNSKLVTFSMKDTPMTGEFPFEDFMKLSNLQNLIVANNNNIYGTFPDISKLTNLEYVYIQGRDLIGSLSENIGLVTGLKELSIIETKTSGSLPTEIGLLRNLVTLELFDNYMTGTIPTELGNLSNLARFVTYDNDLTGTVPSELCNNPKLSTIGVSCSIPSPYCPTLCY